MTATKNCISSIFSTCFGALKSEKKCVGSEERTALTRTARAPKDRVFGFHELSFLRNDSRTGFQVAIRRGSDPTGSPRYLKGRSSFLHPSQFAIWMSQLSLTFTPTRVLLMKLILSPDINSKIRIILFIALIVSTSAFPISSVSSAVRDQDLAFSDLNPFI